MVKEKKVKNIRHEIPFISIEITKLIEILERVVEEECITAETDEHEFESLDDIKSNVILLEGNPEIRMGKITISAFEAECIILRAYFNLWDDSEDSEIESVKIKINKLKAELAKYNVMISNQHVRSFILFFFPLARLFMQTKYVYHEKSTSWLKRHSGRIISAIIGALILLFGQYLLNLI